MSRPPWSIVPTMGRTEDRPTVPTNPSLLPGDARSTLRGDTKLSLHSSGSTAMTEQVPQHTGHGHGYLPAMGHDRLLPFYDPFTRLLGVRSLHRTLADQA